MESTARGSLRLSTARRFHDLLTCVNRRLPLPANNRYVSNRGMVMALDSIVVHLDGKPAVEQRIHIAAQIAKSFRGRLKGIYTPSETDAAVDIAELSPSQLAHRIADRERRARGHSMLRRAAAAAGLAEEEVSCLATNVIEDIVAEMRCADLSVVTQPDFENDAGGFDRRLLENALLGAGGPVLIVP